MSKEHINSVTDGNILKALFSLFFPVMIGAFLQPCYNMIDMAIVGNFIGKEALAAAGGTSSTLVNLLMEFFTGLASGATVVISQYYGAKEGERLKDSVRGAVFIGMLFGGILMIIGLVGVSPALRAVNAPEEIMPLAKTYLRIYFCGMIPMAVYNMGAGILRAVGDTKRPLYFLIGACGLNVILDLLFIAVLGFGIGGAAAATIISQTVSAIGVMIVLARTKEDYCLKIEKHLDHGMIKQMLLIGFPAGFQAMMYSVSNMMMQAMVNLYGTDTIAASSIYDRLEGFFWMIFTAYGIAVTTFMGQNFGACKYDRIKKGVRQSIAAGLMMAWILSAVSICFGRYFFAIFTKDPIVTKIGIELLYFLMPWYFLYVFVEIYSNTIRSYGDAVVPMIICAIGICGVRLVWGGIMMFLHQEIKIVLFAYPVSWGITAVAFFIYFFKNRHKYYNSYCSLN